MSGFDKHKVQALFFIFSFLNWTWVIGGSQQTCPCLSVLLPNVPLSLWLWFVMRCHHPSDRTTCDSNRDGMTAGCWLDWCACFSSGFTDLDKQKPGLPPDSPTGCWSSTAVWSVWVETSCSLLFSFRFRTWGVFAECYSLSVKCRFASLDFGCPAGQTDWLKTHWRIWEKKPSISSVSYFCDVSNCNFHFVERNLISFFFFFLPTICSILSMSLLLHLSSFPIPHGMWLTAAEVDLLLKILSGCQTNGSWFQAVEDKISLIVSSLQRLILLAADHCKALSC